MNVLIREQQTEANEVVQKKVEYLEYIVRHVDNVKRAFNEQFISRYGFIETTSISNEEFRAAIDELKDEIGMHDNSKSGDLEFHGYRVKYYPTRQEQDNMNSDPVYADEVAEKCNQAWLHHLMVNDHHPKHWKVVDGQYQDSNVPKDMSLKAIIHMICDWKAMSYHYKNDMHEWYENNATEEKNDLSPTTRKFVEEILHFLPIG